MPGHGNHRFHQVGNFLRRAARITNFGLQAFFLHHTAHQLNGIVAVERAEQDLAKLMIEWRWQRFAASEHQARSRVAGQ